jgi:HKD family nuclease
MEFIQNTRSSHAKAMVELIAKSDEILMAVAFLKQSGLSMLLPAIQKAQLRRVPIRIITGQYFALTEPSALYLLHEVLTNESSLHLAHASAKDAVFHPKLYLFRRGEVGTIICGSANLTHGGIHQNVECSLMITCATNDTLWRDAYAFISNLLKPEQSKRVDLLTIGKYEQFYESQKGLRRMIKAVPASNKGQDNFSYDKLRIFYASYKIKGGLDWLADKHYHYKNARAVLDEIADSPKLTQAAFVDLLDNLVGKAGQQGWWHSGSLFRNRRSVYSHYKAFQQMVRYIKDNRDGEPEVVYEKARKQVAEIEGAGPNYVTEIMMTYNPRNFANLNNNPITALRVGAGVHMKTTPTAYSGEDYQRYCDLVKEVSREIGLRDMLEADAFFNDIYWQIKNNVARNKNLG